MRHTMGVYGLAQFQDYLDENGIVDAYANETYAKDFNNSDPRVVSSLVGNDRVYLLD